MVRKDISIHVISKRSFRNTMRANLIDDSNVEDYKDMAIISINDPEESDERYFQKDHDNVISLFFHDITDAEPNTWVKCTEDDAKKMYQFIKRKSKDPNVKKFIIHCHAGISRSGAVGEFIQEYIQMKYSIFKSLNPGILPNSYIKSLLNKQKRNDYK